MASGGTRRPDASGGYKNAPDQDNWWRAHGFSRFSAIPGNMSGGALSDLELDSRGAHLLGELCMCDDHLPERGVCGGIAQGRALPL